MLSNDQSLPFRVLHVLSGISDTKSCWPLPRLLRLPIPALDHLLGDALSESMARIQLFDSTVAPFSLIIDDSVVREPPFVQRGRVSSDNAALQEFLVPY